MDRDELELHEFEEEAPRTSDHSGAVADHGSDADMDADPDDGMGVLSRPVERARPPQNAKELEGVFEIPVEIAAVLGHAVLPVDELLKLNRGSLVLLDRKLGEAIDIHVNNRLVARGEVVVVEDKLGISMTEIVKTEP